MLFSWLFFVYSLFYHLMYSNKDSFSCKASICKDNEKERFFKSYFKTSCIFMLPFSFLFFPFNFHFIIFPNFVLFQCLYQDYEAKPVNSCIYMPSRVRNINYFNFYKFHKNFRTIFFTEKFSFGLNSCFLKFLFCHVLFWNFRLKNKSKYISCTDLELYNLKCSIWNSIMKLIFKH